jgi:hypothetical protein
VTSPKVHETEQSDDILIARNVIAITSPDSNRFQELRIASRSFNGVSFCSDVTRFSIVTTEQRNARFSLQQEWMDIDENKALS